jgi:hypothetical protein
LGPYLIHVFSFLINNPQTGEPIKIKASTTVGFRPATALKERMGKKSQPKAKAKAKRRCPLG